MTELFDFILSCKEIIPSVGVQTQVKNICAK